MDKKEQIAFLEESLKRDTQMYLMNEVILRGTQARQLTMSLKPGAELEDYSKAKVNKTELERKIRITRDVIKEIEDGKLKI